MGSSSEGERGPTAEQIEAAKTAGGGWTKEQLAEWGVPWPPPQGWKQRLLEAVSRGELDRLKAACREVDSKALRWTADRSDPDRITHYLLPCGPWHRVLAITGTGPRQPNGDPLPDVTLRDRE